MCIGKKAPKPPKPIAPPPPPPPPKPQVEVQAAVEAEKVDKRRNNRRGMGAVSKPVESMLTGNQGVTQAETNKKLGGANLLGGS